MFPAHSREGAGVVNGNRITLPNSSQNTYERQIFPGNPQRGYNDNRQPKTKKMQNANNADSPDGSIRLSIKSSNSYNERYSKYGLKSISQDYLQDNDIVLEEGNDKIVIHQNRTPDKASTLQTLYSEEGDGEIYIENMKDKSKKLITVVEISTLYKEKRLKSVSLARTYATISHRYLIHVYKLYITKKTLFFEMEAPENTSSWKSFCKRKFTTLDLLTIFRQV